MALAPATAPGTLALDPAPAPGERAKEMAEIQS